MQDIADRLIMLGFAPGTDFNATDRADGSAPTIDWLSDRPRPSEAELAALALPEPVIIVSAGSFWSRTSDQEADAIDAAMLKAGTRVRNLWRVADMFRSDDALWPVLRAKAAELFGETRAAELLAAS